MQLFRAQLSKYIPHPHRDSWMRNNLDDWLQLLRIGSFLTLMAAAWNITKTSSPLGIPDQFLPILQETTGKFLKDSNNNNFNLTELQQYLNYGIAAFFAIAALTSLRCGNRRKPKYTLPVFIAGSLMVLAAVEHYIDSNFEPISVVSYLLPIATPFLLLGYRRLANKIDHWNYYANFFCVTTIFGNTLTYLFYPDKFPNFEQSIFTWLKLPAASGDLAMTAFCYTAIFFALLTALSTTRRLGLFALIAIGLLTCIYRAFALSFSCTGKVCYDTIITNTIFNTSYWLIPLLILMSLASRKNNQTLKL
ncbi:MAG: hypothetical protein ACSHX6_02600 [Akkermansiaceae bacterium]